MTDISTLNRLLDLTVAIQQIPAPTFQEGERAAFIQERFQAESLLDVSMDEAGNVYGRLPGAGKSRPLVVSAHLDTVFPLTTDLHITRHHVSSAEGPILSGVAGPGIGDNSLGVAALFGLLWELRRLSAGQAQAFLPGDIWFVANVGEEGLGNLCGMRRVVDRFDSQPLAYLIVEGMSLGQVYHRGLGVQRYAIKVDTPGGHSWVDYGRPSAIHILAEIVTHLTSLSLPAKPRTTLNVGTISGGTTVNTVAAHAQLELDLRSESPAVLARLADQVEELVQQARHPQVQVTAEIIGQRPPGEIPPS
ncbi:MAG TPA: M20/M25/M40 family metallo-hydrolase, partial [Anaerolineales bacterium]